MKRVICIAAIVCLMFQIATAKNWAEITQQSLHQSKQDIEAYSIGVNDPTNHTYKNILQQSYKKSWQMSSVVQTPGGYLAVMRYFINQFHDEHYNVKPLKKLTQQLKLRWPGFTISKVGAKYVVASHASDVFHGHKIPPSGAVLLSCDHILAYNLIRQRVMPYFGDATSIASWYWNAPYLFINFNNPKNAFLKHCNFLLGKATKKYTLHWHTVSAARVSSITRKAAFPFTGHYQADSYLRHGEWVQLPSFHLTDSAEVAAANKLIAKIHNFRSKNIMVVDLRGNSGGNSIWGTTFLRALYGTKFVEYRLQLHDLNKQQPYTLWKVSRASIRYLDAAVKMLAEQLGKTSEETQAISDVRRGGVEAMGSGKSAASHSIGTIVLR